MIKRPGKSSRKGKKSWVKNVDISAIEASLDELRTEERLGGQLHKLPDEKLFTIERAGDAEVKKSLKHRRLRIDEILDPQSKIPALSQAGRPKTMKKVVTASGKTRLMSTAFLSEVEKMAKRKKADVKRGVVAAPVVKPKHGKKRKVTDDLWGEEPQPTEATNDFLEATKVKSKPVKKPKLPDQRLHHIPAVTVPQPGASYNPSFDDHQNILQSALDVELQKIKEKEHFAKQLSYPPELDDIDDENFFDDSDEEDENAEGETNGVTETADGSALSKKEKKRKTKAQRNKAKAAAKLSLEEEKKKSKKMLLKELDKIPQIESSLETKIKQQEEAASRRSEQRAEKALKPESKKIGPHMYKAAPIEIKLSEELTDRLLHLKPEGSVIKDRFLSLQERAFIEPRVPVAKRQRYKLKETERHDYKRFDKETFANL